MKEIIGYIVIVIGYLAIFWGIPMIGSRNTGKIDWKGVFIITGITHGAVGLCFAFSWFIAWCFS